MDKNQALIGILLYIVTIIMTATTCYYWNDVELIWCVIIDICILFFVGMWFYFLDEI